MHTAHTAHHTRSHIVNGPQCVNGKLGALLQINRQDGIAYVAYASADGGSNRKWLSTFTQVLYLSTVCTLAYFPSLSFYYSTTFQRNILYFFLHYIHLTAYFADQDFTYKTFNGLIKYDY